VLRLPHSHPRLLMDLGTTIIIPNQETATNQTPVLHNHPPPRINGLMVPQPPEVQESRPRSRTLLPQGGSREELGAI
jgi:hypothetical protein